MISLIQKLIIFIYSSAPCKHLISISLVHLYTVTFCHKCQSFKTKELRQYPWGIQRLVSTHFNSNLEGGFMATQNSGQLFIFGGSWLLKTQSPKFWATFYFKGVAILGYSNSQVLANFSFFYGEGVFLTTQNSKSQVLVNFSFSGREWLSLASQNSKSQVLANFSFLGRGYLWLLKTQSPKFWSLEFYCPRWDRNSFHLGGGEFLATQNSKSQLFIFRGVGVWVFLAR